MMIKIFANILRGPALTWFIQLSRGIIKSWSNDKKEFLCRFFEHDTKISIHTFLAKKLREDETVKRYVITIPAWYVTRNASKNLRTQPPNWHTY